MIIDSDESVMCYSLGLCIGVGGKPGRETGLTEGRAGFGNSDERDLISLVPEMWSVLSKYSQIK